MRSVFVQRKVLELYQDMDSVSYPIQPELLLQCIPKSCRILSYQEMAEVTGCTVQDVAVLCKSNSGATHYDPDTNRYLMLLYPPQGKFGSFGPVGIRCSSISCLSSSTLYLRLK